MDDNERILLELIENDDIELINKNKDSCIICNTDNYIINDVKNATTLCTNCGSVLYCVLDDNPEWRNYDDHDNEQRCSAVFNYLLPQSSLGTTLTGKNCRLKTLHNWNAMPYKERSFNVILKQIEEICRKGNIEKRIEHDAKILCKHVIQETYFDSHSKINKNIIIRGLHRDSIIAAAIFFACRRNGKSRSPKEIGELANIDYTNITSGCSAFIKLAELKKINLNLGSSIPEHFIKRFCTILKIPKEFSDNAIKISKNVRKLNIASTHTPISIAIGCILILANILNVNITKKIIKQYFNISEVTINKSFNKLQKYQQIIINDELTTKIACLINTNNCYNEVFNIIDDITLRLNNLKNSINNDILNIRFTIT